MYRLVELALWKWPFYKKVCTDSAQSQRKASFIIHRNRKKKCPEIHMKPQKTLDNQSNPEQKEQCWVTTIPDLKICDRTIIIKPIKYWHKIYI